MTLNLINQSVAVRDIRVEQFMTLECSSSWHFTSTAVTKDPPTTPLGLPGWWCIGQRNKATFWPILTAVQHNYSVSAHLPCQAVERRTNRSFHNHVCPWEETDSSWIFGLFAFQPSDTAGELRERERYVLNWVSVKPADCVWYLTYGVFCLMGCVHRLSHGLFPPSRVKATTKLPRRHLSWTLSVAVLRLSTHFVCLVEPDWRS